MGEKTLTLMLQKSTKGTHVYGSLADDAPIPSVYIKKAALPTTPPGTLRVTLEWTA